MVVLNLLLAWFLVSSAAGRAKLKRPLMVLLGLLMSLQKGTVFALGDWYTPKNLLTSFVPH